jgi:hypothetical protein
MKHTVSSPRYDLPNTINNVDVEDDEFVIWHIEHTQNGDRVTGYEIVKS